MGKIISIANQKGGVGKTTTAINMSTILAKRGKKVLFIDADPQGNGTSGLGVNKEQKFSIYDVLIEDIEVENTLQKTQVKNLDLCPSNMNLAGAEVQLVSMEDREYRLKTKLNNIRDKYDFIIIDLRIMYSPNSRSHTGIQYQFLYYTILYIVHLFSCMKDICNL